MNAEVLQAAAVAPARRVPRKKHNPQLEPDPFVRTTRAGETELLIDSDDDIVRIDGQPGARGPKEAGPKMMSKRLERRAMKQERSRRRVGVATTL